MRLLLDIDDRLFRDVKRLTRAKKKKEAVIIPMREYLRHRQKEALAKLWDGYDYGLTLKQLKKTRKEWDKS